MSLAGTQVRILCPLCAEVWELKHPECQPSGAVLLAGCIPLIREKNSLKTANRCSCRTGGALKGSQDLSKGGERVLPSHSHHPIFPSAPAAVEMPEPPNPTPRSPVQDCNVPACFQLWISAILPFWPGNVSPGALRARIVIPIDSVDWHLAGAGQSQESGVQQPGQHSSSEPSRCSCSLSAPRGRCQPGPFPAARHLTPGTVRWHLLLHIVESRTLCWEKAGREGTRQRDTNFLRVIFFFFRF